MVAVSSTSLVVRYVPAAPALTLAFWRMITASGMLWGFSTLKNHYPLSRSNLKRVLIAGVFLGLHFASFFWGVRHTSIANATILANTGPFFTAIIGFLAGRRFEKKQYFGLFFSIIGVIIIQGAGLKIDPNKLAGNLISLFSGLCIAITYIYAEKIRIKTHNTVYGRSLFLIAGVTIFVIAVFYGENPLVFDKKHFIWFLFLGFVPSILGHNLLNFAIKYFSPTAVASIPLGEPIIASIFAYFLFAEQVPLEAVFGSPFVFVGIYLILNSEKK